MMSAKFKFHCPDCHQRIECATELAGREVNCPGCQQPLIVPSPPDNAVGEAHGDSGPHPSPLATGRLRHVFCGAPSGASEADPGKPPEDEWKIRRRGEVQLACGLGVLIPTAWLAPQVMVGLLAFLLAPAAVPLLLIGVLRARDRRLSGARQAVGLMLLLLAVGGLLVVTTLAMGSSARQARLAQIKHDRQSRLPADQAEGEMQTLARHPAHTPTQRHWTGRAAFWLAPVCMAMGLFCWANWPPWRCSFWGVVVFLMPKGVSLMIHVLGPWMALSA